MKESNVEAVFVQTGFKENVSQFLQKITDEEAIKYDIAIQVAGREGFYIEKPSMMDKYVRRDCDSHTDVMEITYIQFCKRYIPTRIKPEKEESLKPDTYLKPSTGISGYSKLDFIVTHDMDMKTILKKLPKYIRIKDPYPGEPAFVKLRKSYVVRLHKFNQEKKPHEYH